MRNITTFLIALLICASCYAQQALWGGETIISPEIHDDSYKRYTIASSGSHKQNKFTISTSINFSSERNEASPTGQDNSIYRSLNEIATDISIVDLKDLNNKFNNVDNYFTPYGMNPYHILIMQLLEQIQMSNLTMLWVEK
jgi:hypothetical protein